MIPDNQLVIGIVLIGAGLLLALLAYFIITSKAGEEEYEEEAVDEAEPIHTAPDLESAKVEETEVASSDETVDKIPEVEHVEADVFQPGTSDETPFTEQFPADDTILEEAAEIAHTEPQETDRTRPTVATIYRDDVTGELIVKVDDHEYLNAEELKASTDWDRVEYLVSDLAAWLSGMPHEEKTLVSDRDKTVVHPQSMVEQINEILQKKLVESGSTYKAIRLIEDSEGAVKVLVGMQSYYLDEVPDPEARELIREAVTTWEDNQ